MGFFLAELGNLAQKPLLNLRLHPDAVEFFSGLHGFNARGVDSGGFFRMPCPGDGEGNGTGVLRLVRNRLNVYLS
jgi:hypothetical protein